LGRASGLDVDKLRESIRPGVAGSPLLDFVWSRLQAGDLEPGFKLDHFIKDLGLIADVSAELPGVQLVDRIARDVRSERGGDRGTQALATALPGWADRPDAD
jgi:3-hydroxyisobutyrate dehydrogenase